MKVAIVGSRGYARLNQVREYVHSLPKGTVVVSGGALGVDRMAEEAAKERGLDTLIYLPDWDKGKGAGFVRNSAIVKACDRMVAFWDGKSRGTLDSINKAKKAGKAVLIVQADN